MRTLSSLCLGLLGLGWVGLLLFGRTGASAAETAAPAPTFERDIRPILKTHCIECHGEWSTKAGLDLRLRRYLVAGGDSGPAVVAGKPGESLLLERLKNGEMPPRKNDKKLSQKQVALIERWIAAGAPTARPEPEKYDATAAITEENRQFWSFQPIRRPEVPKPKQADRVRTAIDALLLERLEAHGASFAPDADRRTLLRRAYFDLVGLPPTPEEVEQALADPSENWYEKRLEQLLASPQYGERWGRHWLDVAGYADSEGGTVRDNVRPHAFRYRDYVIRAFNADKPFDEFIREQLAGDELAGPLNGVPTPEQIDKLSATGFLQMAPDGTTTATPEERRAAHDQLVADTIKIVSTSLLGLSVGCARCHDHRYDPITQDDYYRFRAIFEPALEISRWQLSKNRQISLYTDEDRARAKEIEAQAKQVLEAKKAKGEEYVKIILEKELAKLPEERREAAREAYHTPDAKRTPAQKQLLREYTRLNFNAGRIAQYDRAAAAELLKFDQQAKKIRDTIPKEGFVQAIGEAPGSVPATYLQFRGDPDPKNRRHEVKPGELTVIEGNPKPAIPSKDPSLPSTGRRLAYAKHLTDGAHPLVARVIVNRVWLHHFGKGLVATPADFGAAGDPPSHPKLLDWLAKEFMDNGWSLKRLHRLIMTSTAYRQGLSHNPTLAQMDSENRLWGGIKARRLEAEIVRDAILAVSGKLKRDSYGPPVPVTRDRVGEIVIGIEDTRNGIGAGVVIPVVEEDRRSVYVQVRRTMPLTFMQMFDLPLLEPNCEARLASTVAPQSLVLMNSPFVLQQSHYFAERLRAEAGPSAKDQVELAWKLAFGRAPTATEQAKALAFVQARAEYFRQQPPAPPKSEQPQASNAAGRDDMQTQGSEVVRALAAKAGPDQSALALLCQALLSSNEFLYID